MPNVQINLRAAEEERALGHDVCQRLRKDPTFADRLKDLMASDKQVDRGLREDVEELERRLRALDRSDK